MLFQQSKKPALHHTITTNNIQLLFNDSQIELVNEYKYLGVTIDSQLTFSKHVKNIIKNVSFRLSKLSKLRNSLSKRTAHLLYNAMVLPIYDYGDLFYHNPCPKLLLNRLQTLQNGAIRLICKLPKRANVEFEHDNLNLLPLTERRNLHGLQFAFHLSQNSNELENNRNILTRALNPSRKQFKLSRPRKMITDRCFSYQIRRKWNALPDALHKATDKASFTQLLMGSPNLLTD